MAKSNVCPPLAADAQLLYPPVDAASEQQLAAKRKAVNTAALDDEANVDCQKQYLR